MKQEYQKITVDFYAGNFYSGDIEIPYDLWHFNRKSYDEGYLYKAERDVYKYVLDILQPLYLPYKVKLIQLKKVK